MYSLTGPATPSSISVEDILAAEVIAELRQAGRPWEPPAAAHAEPMPSLHLEAQLSPMGIRSRGPDVTDVRLSPMSSLTGAPEHRDAQLSPMSSQLGGLHVQDAQLSPVSSLLPAPQPQKAPTGRDAQTSPMCSFMAASGMQDAQTSAISSLQAGVQLADAWLSPLPSCPSQPDGQAPAGLRAAGPEAAQQGAAQLAALQEDSVQPADSFASQHTVATCDTADTADPTLVRHDEAAAQTSQLGLLAAHADVSCQWEEAEAVIPSGSADLLPDPAVPHTAPGNPYQPEHQLQAGDAERTMEAVNEATQTPAQTLPAAGRVIISGNVCNADDAVLLRTAQLTVRHFLHHTVTLTAAVALPCSGSRCGAQAIRASLCHLVRIWHQLSEVLLWFAGPADFAGALALLSVQRSSALWQAIPEELASAALQELLQAARPWDLAQQPSGLDLVYSEAVQPLPAPELLVQGTAAPRHPAAVPQPAEAMPWQLVQPAAPGQADEASQASGLYTELSDLATTQLSEPLQQQQQQQQQQHAFSETVFPAIGVQFAAGSDQPQLHELTPTQASSLQVEDTDTSAAGPRAWQPLSGTFRWSAESSSLRLPGLVVGGDAHAALRQDLEQAAWEHASSLLSISSAAGAAELGCDVVARG